MNLFGLNNFAKLRGIHQLCNTPMRVYYENKIGGGAFPLVVVRYQRVHGARCTVHDRYCGSDGVQESR
jgi:hypothetical protein